MKIISLMKALVFYRGLKRRWKGYASFLMLVGICISCQRVDFKENCDAYSKYNLKGEVKEIKEYYGRWSRDSFRWNKENSSYYRFNPTGNLIEEVSLCDAIAKFNVHKDTLGYHFFNYDKNGYLTSEKELEQMAFDYEDITEKKYALINDTLAKVKVCLQSRDWDSETADTIYYEIEIRYDSNGNKVYERYPDRWHSSIYTITYEYDSLNRLAKEIKMKEFKNDKEEFFTYNAVIMYHYDNKGRLANKAYGSGMRWGTDRMDNPFEVYKKAENGKWSKLENGGYPFAIEYEDYSYNDNGDIVEIQYRVEGDERCQAEYYESYHDDMSSLQTTTTYEYEYDEFNNWVCRLKYSKGNLEDVDKRVLKYYNGKETTLTENFFQEAKIRQQEREERQRRLVEEQPLQLAKVMEHGFESFKFRYWGRTYNSVGYKLKCKLKNISPRTFVKVAFVDKNIKFWGDAMRNPYISIELNNTIRLSCVDFGGSFDNWEKIREISIPEISFESPWKPFKEKEIVLCFQPDVTRGFYWGIEGYGELLQNIHFEYVPTECTLNIPIYLEDITGYKKRMNLCFDIIDDYTDFGRKIN